MQLLRQNTTVKVVIGPVVDCNDGVTPITTLNLIAADSAELLKHDSSSVTDISLAVFTAIVGANGWYTLELLTSHLNTLGLVTVAISDTSLVLPITSRFMVVPTNVWDSLFATDKLQVDVTELAQSALAQFASDDTGQNTTAPGSVAKLAQGVTAATAAAAVWAYKTRSLTQSAAAVTAALSGTDLTILRGDTFSVAFTSLGALTDYTKIWFTVKSKRGDPADTAAVMQVSLLPGTATTDGLLYIQGAAPTSAANGYLQVDDEADGDITIVVEATETAKLSVNSALSYDVQVLKSDGSVTTLTSGDAVVTEDITRSIS